MAFVKEIRDPNTNVTSKLLDAVIAADPGSWTEVLSRDKFSIHIIFGSGAVGVVQVRGSNEDSPAGSNDGIDLVAANLTNLATSGNNIATSTIIAVKIPIKNLKIKVVSLNGGPVSAILVGV